MPEVPEGDGAPELPEEGPDTASNGAVNRAAGDESAGTGDVEPDEVESEAPDLTPEEIATLVAERDQYLDRLQRTAAEYDNFRKRSHKQLVDEVARSQGAFVERLLPVLDAIEAAQSHGSTDVDAIAAQLFGFLEKEGLERVHPDGEAFDPELAEAVVHEPGEGEPTVVEVLRTGYLWNGRVIRAAMVKVAG